jgi:ribosome-binding protein aMBF1 (putative translation factor)
MAKRKGKVTSDLLNRLDRVVSAGEQFHEELESLQSAAPALFKEARDKMGGWKQHHLAKALGTNVTYVSKIETGHLKPGLSILTKLAEALNGKGSK